MSSQCRIPTPAIAILAALVFSGCAARQLPQSTRNAVVAAQQALITANNAADIAAVESLTGEDWVSVNASGVRTTKAELRGSMQKRGAAIVQASPQQLAIRQKDWIVRVYDNVGIVTRLTAGDHGARQWVTTVWFLRDGRWQRVLSQVTNAAP
jgi:ketosteroid isomerase-like protein